MTPYASAEVAPDAVRELRALVEQAVDRRPADSILLSGGLDTGIVAHLAVPRGLRRAVTVVIGEDAPDEAWSRRIADRLGLPQRIIRLELDGLLAELPLVVRTLRTFDPMEVRNSLVLARGLREIAGAGGRRVLTGDAADELFGGYSFLWARPEGAFEEAISRMARTMRFSSIPLGEELGLTVTPPFTDPDVVSFALGRSKAECVGVRDGVQVGKLILRLAFPEVESCWRRKDPIEIGSGSTRLPSFFAGRISGQELAAARESIRRQDRVVIRDPEHLAYYRAFRDVFGESPPLVRDGSDPCPSCRFQLPSPVSDFCVACGAWPVRRTAEVPA